MRTLLIADRDGTLIEDVHYLARPDQVSIISGVIESTKSLADANVDLIVASNQSGVGRGFFSENSVIEVNNFCQKLIDPQKKVLKHFFYCKHTPQDNCSCRKPETGMIHEFLEETSGIYDQIFVIGDRLCDVELAINLQAAPILVLTGKGRQTFISQGFKEYYHLCHVADSFPDAVYRIILQ